MRGDAVLFELRALPSLPSCLLNFVSLLPKGWTIHFWHSDSNAAMIRESSALQPALASGRLVLTPMLSAVPWAYHAFCRNGSIALNRNLHNLLLASTDLWTSFMSPHVLVFQCDATLCPHPDRGLESFAHLTFVGASWPDGRCCNSGLSLWNRSFMVNFTKRFGNGRTRMRSYQNHVDVWASAWLRRINATQAARDAGQPISGLSVITDFRDDRVTLPTSTEGKYFAAETVYTRGYTPFGIHRAWDYIRQREARLELKARCPRFDELAYSSDKNIRADIKNRC